MNRKIFALLLLTPVLIFIGHSLLSGAKSAEKSPPALALRPTLQRAAESAMDDLADRIFFEKEKLCIAREAHRSWQRDELQKELALQQAKGRFFVKMYYQDKETKKRFVDPKITRSRMRGSIYQKVIYPIQEAKVFRIRSEEAFSRCPSGLNSLIASEPNAESDYYEGFLVYSHGCKREILGRFRLSEVSGEAEMLVSEEAGYVSVDEWIALKKELNA